MPVKNIIVDLKSLRSAVTKHESAVKEAAHKAAGQVAHATPDVSEVQLLASWNSALGKLEDLDDDNNHFSINDPIISRLQTEMAERAAAGKDPQLVIDELPGNVKEVKFDNVDPHWIADGIGIGLRKLFHVKPTAWVKPSPVPEPMPDDFRCALFSDWGSGLYGAPHISNSILADANFRLVMHLGDTYYAGSESEIAERLIGSTWPSTAAGATFRSLNGNHEMYSGGKPYFNALRNFFHQSASCFAMQNAKWTIIALDSAYIDGTVEDEKTGQISWLQGILNQAGKRGIILFSHHQPFSQLDREKNSSKLQKFLKPILETGRIRAWFFGHEHRCAIYDPHPTWGLKGRCIGHGGFPAFRDSFQVPMPGNLDHFWQHLGPIKRDGKITVPSARVLDGPNEFMSGEEDRYSPHGYVGLEFKGGDCLETYYLPQSPAHAIKIIRAPEKL